MRDEQPLVRGGQGRTGDDVARAAAVVMIVLILATWLAVMLLCAGIP